MKLFNFKKKKAEKLYQQSNELDDEDQQLDMLMQVLEMNPNHQHANYQVGFIHKNRSNWKLSLKYNKKAFELDEGDEAARWNTAIAATALGEWDIAREAWSAAGVKVKNSIGPVDAHCGFTPIRLNPDGDGEVVWATRIDPARARIDNIPFIESGFGFGDLVLNDGAPVGHRILDDKEYPVFNVLGLLEKSTHTTYTLEVIVQSDEDLSLLTDSVLKAGHEIEDWSSNVRTLCKQCSEGVPHDEHDKTLEKEWTGERTLGVATTDLKAVKQLIDQWLRDTFCVVNSFE